MMKFIKAPKEKIFCIGRNKTGTTSLEQALLELGYTFGDQKKAELLIDPYAKGDFKKIVKFCRTATAFQDVPFSWPYTWLFLYEAYPNAKFILTVRDEEDWYRSITSFHSNKFADGKRIPTKEDLQRAKYRYKGWLWDTNRAVWKTPEDDVYHKETFIDNYRRHNDNVLHFFKDKPNFIAVNISKDEDYMKLCEFLGKEPKGISFPHLNKTKK